MCSLTIQCVLTQQDLADNKLGRPTILPFPPHLQILYKVQPARLQSPPQTHERVKDVRVSVPAVIDNDVKIAPGLLHPPLNIRAIVLVACTYDMICSIRYHT